MSDIMNNMHNIKDNIKDHIQECLKDNLKESIKGNIKGLFIDFKYDLETESETHEPLVLFNGHIIRISPALKNLIEEKNEKMKIKIPKTPKTQKKIHLFELYDHSKKNAGDEAKKNEKEGESESESEIKELELELQAGATLKHTRIHIDIEEVSASASTTAAFTSTTSALTSTATTLINQAENSHYQATVLYLSGLKDPTQFKVNLLGKNASSIFNSLFILNTLDRLNLDFSIQHLAPSCKSDILVRGVVDEEAKARFTGKIVVQQNAQYTEASLENKNLLLSPLALVQTDPILEIHTQEVNCKHGATVGALDEEALFYLQSRGLSRKAAKQFMIQAFLEPILNKIDSPNIKGLLAARLYDH